MDSRQVRQKYLDFFQKKGHAIIPSAPLVPKDDPTVLFTTAGMHPLVPYLMGEPHPLGKRLASVQKCLRTDDIEEVGDMRHFTFFEMLGNWSLGDYFKKEALNWSFEFLTDKKWLNLDPKRVYATVFAGNKDAPLDKESIKIWQEIFEKAGIKAEVGNAKKGWQSGRIFVYEDNWWGPAGQTGPCGPDSEMFYDTGLPHDKKFGRVCHPNCDCGRFVEIWNDVFMQFNKKANGSFESLKQKNVDTGMGFERVVAIMEFLDGKIKIPDPFQTELFSSMIRIIELKSGKKYENYPKEFRIILDHLRAAVFVISDGIESSNKDRGYVLRKLITRMMMNKHKLGDFNNKRVINETIDIYKEFYPEVGKNKLKIFKEFEKEEERFETIWEKSRKLLKRKGGLETGGKIKNGKRVIDGRIAFDLEQTHGIKPEILEELLTMQTKDTYELDRENYLVAKKKHQKISREGAKQRFAGGLQDHSEETAKLHTAAHLLHEALRRILGEHVQQVGSNITAERLRFDFSHPEKLTDEQIKKIEDLVNEQIKKNLKVTKKVMGLTEAKKQGALAFFGQRYGEKVNVYKIGFFSKEVCAGPHVDFTGGLGQFTIEKEESCGAGKRRIYGVLK